MVSIWQKYKQSKFSRLVTSPIKVLTKARDFYVRSMMDCSRKFSYAAVSDFPQENFWGMPRSFSASSSRPNENDDLRELIRAASAKTMGNTIGADTILRKQQKIEANGLRKSCSVAMARIDEESGCDFGDDDGVVKADLLHLRSKSYAIGKRSVPF